ncbi:MAG TPA: GTP cyclohydrolase II [Rhizomicrobium sp.]|nr:GTP cyclohydrolase II [Rhizomicrobium sp.]
MVKAVDAFRRAAPVVITEKGRGTLALAVETAGDKTLRALKPAKARPVYQLLTHARARTLKIRRYTPDVAAIVCVPPLSAARLRTIADPTADLAEPMKGPFDALREKLPEGFAAAVKLAKLAGLLPSVVATRAPAGLRNAVRISVDDIRDYEQDAVNWLALVTRAHVPLEGAEKTELVAFRAHDGGPEHYAIIIESPPRDRPVLTRLHSECFTGDLLGSLKCDCGAQLRGAVDTIARSGGGVLLYLAQEGRGIGLINKLRAYRLQDQGFDTIEANERLGFEADERLYGVAARMLELLGYKSVRLLTNNPEKVAALEAAGVNVAERVPHAFPDNEHNRAYLKTKAAKAGHFL